MLFRSLFYSFLLYKMQLLSFQRLQYPNECCGNATLARKGPVMV